MDEHYHLYVFERSITKAERDCRETEDRFYSENDGAEFRAFATTVGRPIILLTSFLESLRKNKKDPETLPVSGSARQQCC